MNHMDESEAVGREMGNKSLISLDANDSAIRKITFQKGRGNNNPNHGPTPPCRRGHQVHPSPDRTIGKQALEFVYESRRLKRPVLLNEVGSAQDIAFLQCILCATPIVRPYPGSDRPPGTSKPNRHFAVTPAERRDEQPVNDMSVFLLAESTALARIYSESGSRGRSGMVRQIGTKVDSPEMTDMKSYVYPADDDHREYVKIMVLAQVHKTGINKPKHIPCLNGIVGVALFVLVYFPS
ncbi:hypothetical protein B0H16DRAFT_1450984 [Mycena metata]|uniref:Uncharacterized protein n=1 Tax=Mycena metata TaxID=1033252 RepID=A0AAD7NS08_9AGAR|nr:hypothetical protein B0H16DRAFT_1450984 [Mycena metata]